MDPSDHEPRRRSRTPTAVMNPSDDNGVEETMVTGLRGEGEIGFCFVSKTELARGGRNFWVLIIYNPTSIL